MAMLLESAEEQQTPPVSATSVSCRLPTCPPWLQAAIAGQLFVRCMLASSSACSLSVSRRAT